MMKKNKIIFLICICLLMSVSFAMPEVLPGDIGSNADVFEILRPEEKTAKSYTGAYLFSCFAEPGTEITLYTKLTDSLYVPITIDNEAVTGIVGNSGIFMTDLTFEPNSTNKILFYGEKGSLYSSQYKTIIVTDGEEEQADNKPIMNIRRFVSEIGNIE